MLSIGKSHLISDNRAGGPTLSIRPIRSIRRMDTTAKRGCCRSENRISLVTTDPAVQRCRFVHRLLEGKHCEREHKHMNIPRSKNTKGTNEM